MYNDRLSFFNSPEFVQGISIKSVSYNNNLMDRMWRRRYNVDDTDGIAEDKHINNPS